MSRSLPRSISPLTAVCLTILLLPVPCVAQEITGLPAPSLLPALSPGPALCLAEEAPPGPRWQRALEASTLPRDAALATLSPLQDSLAREVADHPDDVELQYLLAVVLGARTEVESGKDKLRIAQELHQRLDTILSLDPDHAGAEYLLGRLNAAVMRMSRLSRFVATRLLGGGALASATWEEAQRLLEAAVAHDPCVADYHFELARLYADRGDRGAARRELRATLLLRARGPRDEMVRARAVDLAVELAAEAEASPRG